jgi:hypothetical protein
VAAANRVLKPLKKRVTKNREAIMKKNEGIKLAGQTILELYTAAHKENPDKDVFTVEFVDDGSVGENVVCIMTTKTYGLKLVDTLAKVSRLTANVEKSNV